MIQCGSLENGFLEFKCETCGEVKRVGFTCKSRFCSSCGKIRMDDWVKDLTKRMAKTNHRHVIFTIPEGVVNYFDTLDDGDLSVPPRFTCEECGEQMEPVEYEGVHGITYRTNV